MEFLTTEDKYKNLCARFNKSRDFNLARRLWLFCHDYDMEMPYEALINLVEGLRKADSDWHDERKEAENKKNIEMLNDCDIHDFVTRRAEGISKESAIMKWAGSNSIEYEKARGRYYKFQKRLKGNKSRFRK